jgi:hypothetical protein
VHADHRDVRGQAACRATGRPSGSSRSGSTRHDADRHTLTPHCRSIASQLEDGPEPSRGRASKARSSGIDMLAGAFLWLRNQYAYGKPEHRQAVLERHARRSTMTASVGCGCRELEAVYAQDGRPCIFPRWELQPLIAPAWEEVPVEDGRP